MRLIKGMKMKIKEYFETTEELLKCFKKWQPRLGLSDWNIGLALVEPNDMDESRAGESDVQWVNKCGTISILKKEYMPKDMLIKQPHESTLIHEMLHFKFFMAEPNSLEQFYHDTFQHQLLEELAKALFLAEYNLPPKWFANVNSEDKE